ncbi:hypothetical protein D3C73_1593560 [compost metagenome]
MLFTIATDEIAAVDPLLITEKLDFNGTEVALSPSLYDKITFVPEAVAVVSVGATVSFTF